MSHTDVLRKAGMKVSAQAEQHGCFQEVCCYLINSYFVNCVPKESSTEKVHLIKIFGSPFFTQFSP